MADTMYTRPLAVLLKQAACDKGGKRQKVERRPLSGSSKTADYQQKSVQDAIQDMEDLQGIPTFPAEPAFTGPQKSVADVMANGGPVVAAPQEPASADAPAAPAFKFTRSDNPLDLSHYVIDPYGDAERYKEFKWQYQEPETVPGFREKLRAYLSRYNRDTALGDSATMLGTGALTYLLTPEKWSRASRLLASLLAGTGATALKHSLTDSQGALNQWLNQRKTAGAEFERPVYLPNYSAAPEEFHPKVVGPVTQGPLKDPQPQEQRQQEQTPAPSRGLSMGPFKRPVYLPDYYAAQKEFHPKAVGPVTQGPFKDSQPPQKEEKKQNSPAKPASNPGSLWGGLSGKWEDIKNRWNNMSDSEKWQGAGSTALWGLGSGLASYLIASLLGSKRAGAIGLLGGLLGGLWGGYRGFSPATSRLQRKIRNNVMINDGLSLDEDQKKAFSATDAPNPVSGSVSQSDMKDIQNLTANSLPWWVKWLR